MSEKSLKFIKYMEFNGAKYDPAVIEGLVNAELEELQKIPGVRIDTIHTRPFAADSMLYYFVQITGRRIVHTQKPKDEIKEERRDMP